MRFLCNCLSVWLKLVLITQVPHAVAFHFLQAKWPKRMLRQMNGRKEAKRKKKWRMDQGRFLLDSTPSRIYPFSHYICFLLFVFCPIGFSIPGFPKKIEIPRQGEGRVGLTVGFTFSWKAILLSKEMASVDLELSSFSLLKGIGFLCKCYSSFCVLADLKTHFKITERT